MGRCRRRIRRIIRVSTLLRPYCNENQGGSEQQAQDKRLTKGEIKKLIDKGVHPHDLKDNSRQDLFKDKDGNIVVKPRSGTGPGEPTGHNINDY